MSSCIIHEMFLFIIFVTILVLMDFNEGLLFSCSVPRRINQVSLFVLVGDMTRQRPQIMVIKILTTMPPVLVFYLLPDSSFCSRGWREEMLVLRSKGLEKVQWYNRKYSINHGSVSQELEQC